VRKYEGAKVKKVGKCEGEKVRRYEGEKSGKVRREIGPVGRVGRFKFIIYD